MRKVYALGAAALFGLAACDQGPLAPPQMQITGGGVAATPSPEQVDLCKDASSGTFTFNVTGPENALLASFDPNIPVGNNPKVGGTSTETTIQVDVAAGTCRAVALRGGGFFQVTIEEIVPAGWQLDAITIVEYNPAAPGDPSVDLANARAIAFGGAQSGVASGAVVTFFNSEVPTGEGCTPGFWKNRAITINAWAATGYSPGQTLGSVFTVPAALNPLASTTLLAALDLGGGSGVQGAARNLLRAATAALLNAANPSISYPMTTAEVIAAVNAALTKGSDTDAQWRARMLALAEQLDGYNNLGCPLGAATSS